MRALVAASAGVGLAYLAARRAGSGDAGPSIEEIREEVAPGSAGDDGADGSETSVGGGSASGVRQRDFDGAEDEDESSNPPTGSIDVGEERTDDELAELAESDAGTDPAEPGEMTVDDEVVENLVDESDRE